MSSNHSTLHASMRPAASATLSPNPWGLYKSFLQGTGAQTLLLTPLAPWRPCPSTYPQGNAAEPFAAPAYFLGIRHFTSHPFLPDPATWD
jgi:hypothetical protein